MAVVIEIVMLEEFDTEITNFSPLCIANVPSHRLSLRMHSHIGCICLAFLHCAFSYVSSSLPQMQNHTGCICLTFLRCVFSDVPSKRLHRRMHNHTGCICLTFLRCVFSNVSSDIFSERTHIHIGCTCLTSLYYLLEQ